jgi:hypothetical protein
MCTQVKIRAFNAVLPPELIKQTKNNEKTKIAAEEFVVSLIKETIRYVAKKEPKGLDAFPGDRLCQGRVTILPELFENPAVCKELEDLAIKIEAKNEIALLEISKDVHYLMDCRILMITRAVASTEPSGISRAKTEHRQLASLSKGFSNHIFEKIAFDTCSRISKETMERLQDLGRRMKVPELHQRMLDTVVVFNLPKMPPRTFGCGFFTVHLALHCLLARKTPLAIKTTVPQGPSHLLFFEAKENDFEFQEAPQFEKTSYVTIVQAVVPSQEALLAKIKEIGFIELVLRQSALETPFEHTSTLDSVKDLEGRTLIEEYIEKASGCDERLLKIHHMYPSTIQEEVM